VTEPIPLVDLRWQHAQIEAALVPRLHDAMSSGSFIGGAAVAEFEAAFASECEAAHCVGTANGTDALEIALRCAGVEAGDAVVLPANTFIATAEAAWRIGARIVLVDCDEHHLIDVDQLDDAVRASNAKAIIPVHLYGQFADIDGVAEVAERHGCAVVEDAAQCQGARRNGEPIARHSAVAATSFYPGKNLGAYGDAGAIVTNSDDIARRARLLGNHGSDQKYVHDEMGMNSRLDAIQAIVLAEKLRKLSGWNELRQAAAARYDELLADTDIEMPLVLKGNNPVWHLYVVQVDERDRVLADLNEQGIGAAIHYPVPIHLQRAGASLGYARGAFPMAERASERILSLPLFPGITTAQQDRVVEVLVSR
jgi:dTDP-4-amino-4,6-dideoxygalactose transaminase